LKNQHAKSRINISPVDTFLRSGIMSERPDELKKLAAIAADMQLPGNLRTKAIDQIGSMASYDSLLALLEIAANEGLATSDRDRALKQARDVIKKTSHQ
jgi:hypothetical protein